MGHLFILVFSHFVVPLAYFSININRILFFLSDLSWVLGSLGSKGLVRQAETVVQIHNTFVETLYPYSIKFKLISMFFVRTSINADGFAYVSQYAKEESEKYYRIGQCKNSILENHINLYVFNTKKESLSREVRRLFRECLGMYSFGGMCLNVSLDEPRKDLETFLNMARLGRIFHFSAFPTNALRSFYHHADLFVSPSWVEGLGLPPLEVIACGTPAVCADTSGLHKNLEGICPLIFPPDHVDDYLSVLDAALRGEQKLEKVQALLARFSVKLSPSVLRPSSILCQIDKIFIALSIFAFFPKTSITLLP